MGKPPTEAKSATIQHFSHPHPLNLTSVESQATLVPPSCSCCTERVTSWAYTCQYCRFFLHTDCSNLPQLVNHQWHTIHNLTLLTNDKERYECAACGESGEGFSYHCGRCSLNLHTACSIMPTQLVSNSHQHQLFLTFYSPYPTQTFSCDVCGNIGSKWLYRCNVCEFDAHLKCAKDAPATQPHAGGGGPAMHPNPSIIAPPNGANVQVPMMANNMGGIGGGVVAPVRPNYGTVYGTAAPNMVRVNSGHAVGYVPSSQGRPVAMHQGSYNGSAVYQVGNPAPINGSAVYQVGNPAPINGSAVYQVGNPAPINGSAVYQVGNPAPINGSVTYPVARAPFFNAQSCYAHSNSIPAQHTVPLGFNGNQGVNQQRNEDSFTNQILLSAISGATEGLVGSMLNGGSNNSGGVVFVDGGGGDAGMYMDGGGGDAGVYMDGGGGDAGVYMDGGGA